MTVQIFPTVTRSTDERSPLVSNRPTLGSGVGTHVAGVGTVRGIQL